MSTSSAAFPPPLIAFSTKHVDFELVGGKGANLLRLTESGFNVPDGFLVPTSAYRQYLAKNQLEGAIASILEGIDPASPQELETASAQIRSSFSEGSVPETLAAAIRIGWQRLGAAPVAVRSSATAEDLPEMSFAGQQDTFLNVIGEEEILEAVVRCWSSLWTARAIGYRTRNHIPHAEVTLSVVLQNMVESEVSGVMFTANPLTGLRGEIVIDAALGLGEALVSGQVEPDHYTVDTSAKTITQKTIGSKALVIRGTAGGGVQTQEGQTNQTQALPDEAILQLAGEGKKIEAHYGFPQDIEWAWKDGELYILQSRPITSLFPIPEHEADGLNVYFSFGAVQGMLDPMTPLGQDAIRLIFAGGASLLNIDVSHKTQKVIYNAGERLWGNITAVIRNPLGAKLVPKIFPGIEPGSLPAMKILLDDPKIRAGSGKVRLRTFFKLARFWSKMLRKALQNFSTPEEKAALIKSNIDSDIARINSIYATPPGESLPLADLPKLVKEIQRGFIFAVPEIASGALLGLAPMLALNRIAEHADAPANVVLELTRGLPNNVTTQMDLLLWETARAIKQDTASLAALSEGSAVELAEAYLQADLPETAQTQIQVFLNQYGMRGVAEIDLGRPRWRENPTQIIQTIQSYLKFEDEASMPNVVFKRSEEKAAQAQESLEQAVLKTFGGRLKTKMVSGIIRRVRALGGLRESPKFYIIQMMGIIRKELLKTGEVLVQRDKLAARDDLFYLYVDELEAFAQGEQGDWQTLIEERRQTFQRELRRKQIPRLLVSDGRAFYEGLGAADADADGLSGSPVSPGMIEGTVRVVFDPHDANLSPGEILVCPATDPAWTPLFLAAGGLVMEVGGLMTHGAIVAREYGIPAVVGVNLATQRLQTGDRIRVNGTTGMIEILNYLKLPPD